MAKIVCREPTHLGFCDASGIGTGGVWLDSSRSVPSIVWRHPWLPDTITALLPEKNPRGTIINSGLELATIILHKTTLLDVCPDTNVAAPRSGSDNTSTVSWSTREASTISLVVVDLFCISELQSRQVSLNPSIFYHPGQEKCIADDASRIFEIFDTPFLAHMSATYLQPQICGNSAPRL